MNINEGVLDDIEETSIVDDDIIKLPSAETTNKEPILIVATDDDRTVNSLVPQALIEKLPEMDVSLKIVTDGEAKVVSLQDIETEIVAQEAMSVSMAQYVELSFESLLKGPIKLNEFTKDKSKTNYDYVTRHMSNVINLEQAALASSIEVLLDKPLQNAEIAYNTLLSACIPSLEYQFFDLRSLVASHIESISQNKDVVFPYGDNTFLNILTTDLASIDPSKFVSMDKAVEGNLSSLALSLKKPALVTLVHCVKDGKSVHEALTTEFHPTYSGSSVTGQDLLKFYSSDVDAFIKQMASICAEQISFLNSVSFNSKSHVESKEAMNAFLSNSLPGIQTAFAILSRYMNLIHEASIMNFSAQGYINFLSKL